MVRRKARIVSGGMWCEVKCEMKGLERAVLHGL